MPVKRKLRRFRMAAEMALNFDVVASSGFEARKIAHDVLVRSFYDGVHIADGQAYEFARLYPNEACKADVVLEVKRPR